MNDTSCTNCGNPVALKRCTKCGARYCSTECQKADWKEHKKVCVQSQSMADELSARTNKLEKRQEKKESRMMFEEEESQRALEEEERQNVLENRHKARLTYPPKNGAKNVYVGFVKTGNVRDGRGTMTYANGDVYEGKWSVNKRHGQGKMTYANGAVYEGLWKDNTPDIQYIREYIQNKTSHIINSNLDRSFKMAYAKMGGDIVQINMYEMLDNENDIESLAYLMSTPAIDAISFDDLNAIKVKIDEFDLHSIMPAPDDIKGYIQDKLGPLINVRDDKQMAAFKKDAMRKLNDIADTHLLLEMLSPEMRKRTLSDFFEALSYLKFNELINPSPIALITTMRLMNNNPESLIPRTGGDDEDDGFGVCKTKKCRDAKRKRNTKKVKNGKNKKRIKSGKRV
jgi:hypothetical protein